MSAAIPERLAAAPAVRACQAALGAAEGAWIVGGAIRDAALGREVRDVDLAVAGDERAAAREIGRAAGGARVPAVRGVRELARPGRGTAPGTWTSPGCAARGSRPTWRCATSRSTRSRSRWPTWRRRRSTRMAGSPTWRRRLLRAVSARSFADDPLRILRAARIAAGLGLEIDPDTVELARAEARRAGEPAGERQFAELRLLLTGADPVRGLELLDELGATPAVLPELEALRGVEQNPYHHLDVYGHTMEVLGAADRGRGRPGGRSWARRPPTFSELLAEPLADELTRGGALRFAALVPRPRQAGDARASGEGGRVLFIGHDRAGARLVRELCSAAAREPAPRRLPGQPDPQPPAARLPGPRAAALAAPGLRLPAGHRSGLRGRHPAHGRRPARHPGRAHPAGGDRRPSRAGARDGRRGPGVAPRRAAALADPRRRARLRAGHRAGPRARQPAGRDRGGGVRGRGLDARGGRSTWRGGSAPV